MRFIGVSMIHALASPLSCPDELHVDVGGSDSIDPHAAFGPFGGKRLSQTVDRRLLCPPEGAGAPEDTIQIDIVYRKPILITHFLGGRRGTADAGIDDQDNDMATAGCQIIGSFVDVGGTGDVELNRLSLMTGGGEMFGATRPREGLELRSLILSIHLLHRCDCHRYSFNCVALRCTDEHFQLMK